MPIRPRYLVVCEHTSHRNALYVLGPSDLGIFFFDRREPEANASPPVSDDKRYALFLSFWAFFLTRARSLAMPLRAFAQIQGEQQAFPIERHQTSDTEMSEELLASNPLVNARGAPFRSFQTFCFF